MSLADARPPRAGIYFLADDHAVDWAAVLLESLRLADPDIAVRCLPYSARIDRLARLRACYRFDFVDDPAFATLDELSRALDPRRPNPMFRKLATFWGPFDDFLYLDADVAVFSPPSVLATMARRSGKDVLYAHADLEQVYSSGEFRDAMVRQYGSQGINAGVWGSRAGLLTLSMVETFAAEAKPHVRHFHRNLDQAFINYCIDRRRLQVTSFQRASGEALMCVWPGDPVWAATPLLSAATGESTRPRVALAHWAGFPLRPDSPHYATARHFRHRAFARMRDPLPVRGWWTLKQSIRGAAMWKPMRDAMEQRAERRDADYRRRQ